MTILSNTIELVCDSCGATIRLVTDDLWLPRDLNLKLQKMYWTRGDYKDLCAKCSKQNTEENKKPEKSLSDIMQSLKNKQAKKEEQDNKANQDYKYFWKYNSDLQPSFVYGPLESVTECMEDAFEILRDRSLPDTKDMSDIEITIYKQLYTQDKLEICHIANFNEVKCLLKLPRE